MGFYSTAEDQAALMNSFRNMQQQNPEQPQRRSSLIASFLPTALSLAGGALGSVIAPGVGTAAGGAGGAVLGKKLQDMMTGNHSGLGSYLGEAAFGSLGGLGKAVESVSGASKALRAGEDLSTAAKALQYGTKGAEAVGDLSSANTARKAIEATMANNSSKGGLIGAISNKAAGAGDKALMSQVKGADKITADAMLKNTRSIQDLGYNNLEKLSADAKHITGTDGILNVQKNLLYEKAKPIDTSSFGDIVRTTASEHPNLIDAAEKKAIKQATSIADRYGFEGGANGIGVVPAKNVQGAIKELDRLAYSKGTAGTPAGEFYKNLSNDLKGTLKTAASDVPLTADMKGEWIRELRSRGVNNPKLFATINKAQTGADLAKIESPFVAGSKAYEQTMRSEMTGMGSMRQPTVMGVAENLVGNPIRSAAGKGAGLLSKLTGKTGNPENVLDLAGNTAKSMAKVQLPLRFMTGQYSQSDQANAQPNDIMQTNSDGSFSPTDPNNTNDTFSMSDPTAQTPPTGTGGYDPTVNKPEDISSQLMTAAQHALAAGDTKGLDNIMKVASLYEAQQKLNQSAGKDQKLSAAQQARKDALTSAFATLDAAPANLASGGGAKGVKGELGKTPWLGKYLDPQAAAYTNTKIEMATQLAKALTGGSRAPQNVIDYYMHSLPDVNDPPEYAAAKLSKLKAELTAQAQRFGYTDIIDNGGDSGSTDTQSSGLLNRFIGA